MITVTASSAQRTSFCGVHLVGAAAHARRALSIEVEFLSIQPRPKFSTERHEEHQSSVLAAVVQAAAAIEAGMNEVFLDAVDAKRPAHLAHLANAEVEELRTAWENGAEALSPLDKAQTVLALLHRAPLERGAHPYQDAALLLKLRNALVHAKAEWVVTATNHSGDSPSKQKFEAQLGGKVKDNPLTGPGNAYFPDRVLSGDCARWALRSAVDLMDAVHKAMGAASPYDHVRSRFPA